MQAFIAWFGLGAAIFLLNLVFGRLGKLARITLRQAWRVVIFVIGLSIIFAGIALVFLPGPAFLVIPLGLAVLATEFLWARRLLTGIKRRAMTMLNSVTGAGDGHSVPDPPSGDQARNLPANDTSRSEGSKNVERSPDTGREDHS